MGQSTGYINTIEKRQVFLPSMGMFLCICEYFNITPKEFLMRKNNEPALINEIVKESIKSLTEVHLRAY
ncbi:MAG: hypothetical protein L6V93_01035 [Clostridiales bacterium]|nr:MAG: hypothetical protein L6V93_01035 [Clostridiales bacterium]